MEKFFTDSPIPVVYKSEKIQAAHPLEHDVFQRHRLLEQFDQEALCRARVSLIGAGGLGSEIGMALVRKGIGDLSIYDDDLVDLSNLSRQYYFRRDLYKRKAECLARNLYELAPGETLVRGIPMLLQDAVAAGHSPAADIAIVGVDNNEARFFCARHFKDIPVIFAAVSPEADSGYVFVQEPGHACFGCEFGEHFGRPARKCTGSTIDINKSVAGIVSYAVDSLLMPRARDWNYKRIHFHGPFNDICRMIPPNPSCSFCGGGI